MKKLISIIILLTPSLLWASDYRPNLHNVDQLMSASQTIANAHSTANQQNSSMVSTILNNSQKNNTTISEVDARKLAGISNIITTDGTPTSAVADLINMSGLDLASLYNNALAAQIQLASLGSPAAVQGSTATGYGTGDGRVI